MLTISIDACFAQNFYKDLVKYQDVHSKPRGQLSKSKLHSMNKQNASEFKILFKAVKVKTGFDMLGCDTIYIIEIHPDFYLGGYTKLIWNRDHSSYYENLNFSMVENERGSPGNIETDAKEKLVALGPVLKRIIQKSDTVGFRKYIFSTEMPIVGDAIAFMVANKVHKHWHFFRSGTFALSMPD
jgi:hypothetical protein